MIPGSANPLLLASATGAAGYEIERSLRFNSSDSAYLSRTPASAGNRKTFTFSTWVKLCNTNNTQNFLNAGDNSTVGRSIFRYSSEKFGLIASAVGGTTAADVTTDAVFRDFSAWYHLLWAVDTTQATSTNRVKLWVNGVAQQLTFTAAPDLDGVFSINNNSAHRIGGAVYTSGQFPDYYLADCFLIDGQALDPTSFGEFDANGVWQPKAYTGTYPGNSFHLPFSDNSTTAALGTDTSGAGNNWTVNNISVAAGSGNDSLVDTPTNYGTDTGAGGEVRGNYATLNPLDRAAIGTLFNGNLKWVGNGTSSYCNIRGTQALTGKIYFEAVINVAAVACSIGVAPGTDYSKSIADTAATDYFGSSAWGSNCAVIGGAFGTCYSNGSSAGSFTGATNDILMCAFDQATGKVWFGRNGTWLLSGNPATGSNPTFTIANTLTVYPASTVRGTDDLDLNFGARPFAYTAPSGFKALCTANLPEPQTITTSGSYTGNGVADGPFVYLNGVPTAMTVNGNAVTFGTHADKLSNGFKVRTTSTTYNQNAVVYNYSITSTGDPFKRARAQSNP